MTSKVNPSLDILSVCYIKLEIVMLKNENLAS